MQKSKEIKVFPAEGGFRVLRQTSRERAELQESLGLIRREYDSRSGSLLGFRVVGVELHRIDSDLKSMPSSSSISGPKPSVYRGPTVSDADCDEDMCAGRGARLSGEIEMNALGKSRTWGRSELDRLIRQRNGLAPEDKIERVKAKVRVYALVGPAKGDILRVWPR